MSCRANIANIGCHEFLDPKLLSVGFTLQEAYDNSDNPAIMDLANGKDLIVSNTNQNAAILLDAFNGIQLNPHGSTVIIDGITRLENRVHLKDINFVPSTIAGYGTVYFKGGILWLKQDNGTIYQLVPTLQSTYDNSSTGQLVLSSGKDLLIDGALNNVNVQVFGQDIVAQANNNLFLETDNIFVVRERTGGAVHKFEIPVDLTDHEQYFRSNKITQMRWNGFNSTELQVNCPPNWTTYVTNVYNVSPGGKAVVFQSEDLSQHLPTSGWFFGFWKVFGIEIGADPADTFILSGHIWARHQPSGTAGFINVDANQHNPGGVLSVTFSQFNNRGQIDVNLDPTYPFNVEVTAIVEFQYRFR